MNNIKVHIEYNQKTENYNTLPPVDTDDNCFEKGYN
jgi:hypothetical protein